MILNYTLLKTFFLPIGINVFNELWTGGVVTRSY